MTTAHWRSPCTLSWCIHLKTKYKHLFYLRIKYIEHSTKSPVLSNQRLATDPRRGGGDAIPVDRSRASGFPLLPVRCTLSPGRTPMTHYETLHLHTDSGIHTILLNRPEKRNALNHQLMEELTHALESCAASQSCRVIIITGAGSSFCAGLDLEHLRTLPPEPGQPTPTDDYNADAQRIATLLRTLYAHPRPTIAAVNGPAIAGGAGIATLCDFTLAVPEAKFGYTEVRIGFVPAVVSAFLRVQIGEKKCRDLLLTGRLFSAEEALSLGLVNRIVDEPDLMGEAKALAQRLLRNSPAAMKATKRLLCHFSDRHLRDDIDAAIRASVDARSNADFHEGVSAFLEKREPQWPSAHTKESVGTT
jgi:methylglutaconyl-CoA hydratase